MKIFSLFLLLFICTNRLSAQVDDGGDMEIADPGITSTTELANILYIYADHVNMDSLLPLTPIDTSLSMQQKALLVGGYWCDISLFMLPKGKERGKEIVARITVLKNLFGQLHIPFSEDLENRANKNVANPDSLGKILAKLNSGMERYLTGNNQKDLFKLISIGGMLEGLYVSARSFPAYKKEETQMMNKLALTMKNFQESTAHQPVYSPVSDLVKKLCTLLPANDADEKTVKANHGQLIISTREIRTLMLV